jgi:hypothetical protein
MDTGEIDRRTSDRGSFSSTVLVLNRFDGSEKENGLRVSLLETVRGRYKRTPVEP